MCVSSWMKHPSSLIQFCTVHEDLEISNGSSKKLSAYWRTSTPQSCILFCFRTSGEASLIILNRITIQLLGVSFPLQIFINIWSVEYLLGPARESLIIIKGCFMPQHTLNPMSLLSSCSSNRTPNMVKESSWTDGSNCIFWGASRPGIQMTARYLWQFSLMKSWVKSSHL